MNATTRFAALALSLVAAGAAFADDPTVAPELAVVTSNVSRAQVAGETLQARAAGTLKLTDADFRKEQPSVSVRNRAEVRAEAAAAVASGDTHAYEGSNFAVARPARRQAADVQMAGVAK